MTSATLTFFVDLYIVRMRAFARGETQVVELLKKFFPEIFEKDNEKLYEEYCKKRSEIRLQFTDQELIEMLSSINVNLH
jgi:hypothetical protein